MVAEPKAAGLGRQILSGQPDRDEGMGVRQSRCGGDDLDRGRVLSRDCP
jgi:hypothetical protein